MNAALTVRGMGWSPGTRKRKILFKNVVAMKHGFVERVVGQNRKKDGGFAENVGCLMVARHRPWQISVVIAEK